VAHCPRGPRAGAGVGAGGRQRLPRAARHARGGNPAHDPGTILNGLHETWPIVYSEDAFGLARTGQTIVPPPDGSIIRLTVDGEALDVARADVVRRELDMRRGVMYVPRHEELGIALQDEHFLDRPRWDFDGTPPEAYPLLLHHHPLEIYRHQVIKQTDVVLATYLLDRSFSEEEIRRTFECYDPLTTGDSTLSACVQGVVASAAGQPEAALRYVLDACAVDLLDSHGNTADGLHIASCGGTWLALVAGFGGLRDFDGEVRLHPRLPSGWERLSFRVEVRGQLLEVDMTPSGTTYTLVDGTDLQISHCGELLRIVPGAPVVRASSLKPLALAA